MRLNRILLLSQHAIDAEAQAKTYSRRNMPGNTFIESLLSEDPEGSSKTAFQIRSLFMLLLELRRLREAGREVVVERFWLLISVASSGGVARRAMTALCMMKLLKSHCYNLCRCILTNELSTLGGLSDRMY